MGLGVDRVVRITIWTMYHISNSFNSFNSKSSRRMDNIELSINVKTATCSMPFVVVRILIPTQFMYLIVRIGGGGTFGVVLESTVLASPQVVLQAVIVSFSNNSKATRQLWDIVVENAEKWTNDSWGGLVNANTAIYVTPKLSKSEAAQSMDPLIQFGRELIATNITGVELIVTTFPSYGSFFEHLSGSKVGVSFISQKGGY